MLAQQLFLTRVICRIGGGDTIETYRLPSAAMNERGPLLPEDLGGWELVSRVELTPGQWAQLGLTKP